MKKKFIGTILSAVVSAMALAGCGVGSGDIGFVIESEESQYVSVTSQPVYATPKPDDGTQGIQLLYYSGELTKEEEAEALGTIQTMHQNLELEDYLGEGIHMISDAEWMNTFAVRLVEGSRTYYLQEDGEILLTVQVGYDVYGKAVSNVFYQEPEGKITLLKQAGGITQLITASAVEGKYDGAFELWQFDSETGGIRHEEGTYAAGLPVGEYTIAVREGNAAGEAFDLWNNREGMTYTTTTLKYDDKGELIPEATPTPTSTPKPTETPTATPKPAVTPKPATTPKPVTTPKPTPQPSDDNNDDNNEDNGGSDDGGNDSGSSNDGGSGDNGSGGGDSGSGDGGSGGSGGADVDVEWSDDIL